MATMVGANVSGREAVSATLPSPWCHWRTLCDDRGSYHRSVNESSDFTFVVLPPFGLLVIVGSAVVAVVVIIRWLRR